MRSTIFAGMAGALGIVLCGAWFGVTPAQAQSSNCYETFWPSGHAVEIEACEYSGGSTSGYTILRNLSGQNIDVCWTLHFRNGRSDRGCHSGLRAGTEAKSSCYSCNRNSGGPVESVSWRSVRPST